MALLIIVIRSPHLLLSSPTSFIILPWTHRVMVLPLILHWVPCSITGTWSSTSGGLLTTLVSRNFPSWVIQWEAPLLFITLLSTRIQWIGSLHWILLSLSPCLWRGYWNKYFCFDLRVSLFPPCNWCYCLLFIKHAQSMPDAIHAFLDWEKKTCDPNFQPKTYTLEELVNRYVEAMDGTISSEAVRILLKRGSKAVGSGFIYSHDPRMVYIEYSFFCVFFFLNDPRNRCCQL